MSEETLVNDAITSDDAGFVSDAGAQAIDEPAQEAVEESTSEAVSEEGAVPEVQAETKEEFQEEVAEAIENGASEQDIQDMVKEFKLKVNGREITKKIDLSDEEAIRRELQLAAAGQSAMQQKRELEKLYEQEIARLRENPWETMRELGIDDLELAKSRLEQEVKEMEKSPEVRKAEQLERELQKAREELENTKKAQQEAEYQKMLNEAEVELETEIIEALDAHTTLPQTPETIMRVAQAMDRAMEAGYDVAAKDVIPSVIDGYKREFSGLMDALPEEMIEEYIGKKNLERVRKKRLSTIKPTSASDVKPTSKSIKAKEEDSKPKKKIKYKDYFKNLGR
jgi:hypothetical protein